MATADIYPPPTNNLILVRHPEPVLHPQRSPNYSVLITSHENQNQPNPPNHTWKIGAMSQSAESNTRVLADHGRKRPLDIKNLTRPGVPTATWHPPRRALEFSATGTPPTRETTTRPSIPRPRRSSRSYDCKKGRRI